jgi:hypothetical protein
MDELDPIEAFFAGYPPEVQSISRTLRVMVQDTMPQANETLFAKENHIAYSFSASRRDTICYICPLKDYVRLGFMYGTHLPDPHQLLIGEGQRLRHVKVGTSEGASNPALKQLVEAAWANALTHMKKKSKV